MKFVFNPAQPQIRGRQYRHRPTKCDPYLESEVDRNRINARTNVFQLKVSTCKGVQFDAQIFAGSDELMFYKGDANSLMSTTDPSVCRTEASKEDSKIQLQKYWRNSNDSPKNLPRHRSGSGTRV